MTVNSYLMQRQADLLGIPVDVASVEESTALGIAGLAGFGDGYLDVPAISAGNPSRATYAPALPESERQGEREAWEFVSRHHAVGLSHGRAVWRRIEPVEPIDTRLGWFRQPCHCGRVVNHEEDRFSTAVPSPALKSVGVERT